MEKMTYIVIPMPVLVYKYQRVKASSLQQMLERKGRIVINPFELMDQLDRTHHRIAGCDATKEEEMRERMNNVAFSEEVYVCKGWFDDDVCVEEVNCAKKLGKNIEFE